MTPKPVLSFIERLCGDHSASVRWYGRFLDLEPAAMAGPVPFSLFDTGRIRLAIKQGEPAGKGDLLYFQVPSLDRALARLATLGIHPLGETKASPEGYRRALFADPDGGRVGLFESIAEPAAD